MASRHRTWLAVPDRRSGPNRVLELPIPDSDAALVAALRAGRADASTVLFDRYGADVERVLYGVLGPDAEIKDLLHDVFIAALESFPKLRDPDALRGWLIGIAVRKARKCITRRSRWRFIELRPSSELPEREAPAATAEMSDAVRCTYAVLQRMPADERLAFALRYIESMELVAVAAACGVSLATIKRRLSRAHETFTALASEHAALTEWLGGGRT